MAAGAVSVSEIDLAKDFKFSSDKLLQQWMYKYGPKETSRRYDHLQLIVKEECFEASVQTRSDGPYGPEMLARIRSNLRQATAHHSAQLASMGITYNHLFGIVGILTEDCAVWWTDPFDLARDEGNNAS